MSPLLLLAVGVAGGVGAGLRFLVDAGLHRVFRGAFPLGILIVNVTGSLALGIVTGAATGTPMAWVVGAGLLGGYTTFSTVMVETWLLGEAGERRTAWANALGSVLACAAAAALGLWIGALVLA